MKKQSIQNYYSFLIIFFFLSMAGISQSAFASAFQIMEQNVTNLGTAYAGTASLAEDASTGFFNSAGLTRLGEEQIAISAVGLRSQAKLLVDRALPTAGPATTIAGVPGSTRIFGQALIPGVHYAHRLNDCWIVGLNVIAPFGLQANYREDSIARYMSTRSELRTFDIAPSLAYSFGNGLSLGAGFDAVHARAQFDTRIGTGNPATDGFREDKAERWGFGGHVGALYEFSDCTRLGLNYRSDIRINARGESVQQNPAALDGAATQLPIRARVTLPATAVVSGYHAFNDCWALMADVQWTNWRRFKEIRIERDDGQILTQTHNFKDTYRFALGSSYQLNDCWLFRFGTAFDQSPVRDEYRTTRIPDSDRYWLSFGGRYSVCNNLFLDFGYSHLFFKSASLRERAPTGIPGINQQLDGRTRFGADLLGLQVTWDII